MIEHIFTCPVHWPTSPIQNGNVTSIIHLPGGTDDIRMASGCQCRSPRSNCKSFKNGLILGQVTKVFMADLSSRLSHRVQLATDGHWAYLEAVERAFECDVDYARLRKLYGKSLEDEKGYSPAKCVGTQWEHLFGKPDPKHVSTSYAERQNLTMRMSMRHFTRLTNDFSKKVENLEHAVALHFMHYNFVRTHSGLKTQYPTTPSIAAGVDDKIWTVKDIVSLIDNY